MFRGNLRSEISSLFKSRIEIFKFSTFIYLLLSDSAFFSAFFYFRFYSYNYFFRGVNFFPAIAIALPFLVRALQWVLCPRTGNFFLCLEPL